MKKYSGGKCNTGSDQSLENVHHFKYLGSRVYDDASSTTDIILQLSTTMSKMTEQEKLLKCYDIRLLVKISLFYLLIASIALYGCKSLTLTTITKCCIQTFEMKCLRKILNILFIEHRTNKSIIRETEAFTSCYELILATVKRWKVICFEHVMWHNSVTKTIVQEWVKAEKARGRPKIA